MQNGFLKYDEWNDLIWIYNSISPSVTYNISGSLIGLNHEDKTIKHIHSLKTNSDAYNIVDDYNCYCGCYDNTINSLGVYEEYLLVGKSKDLYVVSKDGYRVMKVLCSSAKEEITLANTMHISCAVFPTTKNDPKIVLSNNSDELYFIDACKGQIKSKLNAQIENSMEYRDKITSISDFMSNQSNSSCYYSYQPEYPTYESPDYSSVQYPTEYKNQDSKYGQYTPSTSNDSPSFGEKQTFSFSSIAEKYGDINSIPEFVPSSYSFTHETNENAYEHNNNSNEYYTSNSFGYKSANSYGTFGTGYNYQNMPSTKEYVERENGSITLEWILSEMKPSIMLQNDFVDSTCIGTCSGILHIVDNRINKIVSSVCSHSNPVYSISASNNTIATTSCTLYPCQNTCTYPYNTQSSYNSGFMTLFDPVLCLYDIRMMKSFSMVFHRPLSNLFIVPKSDRLFAMSPDGKIFDFKISTLEYKMALEPTTGSGFQYGLEVVGNLSGDSLEVFVSDSTYNFESLKLPNELKEDFGYSSEKLPRNLSEIPISENREYNNTPFASMVGTFEGDVAHTFVQMFFFLPKLSSIQYHICELSNCITCQIGFGLHNLQVYYDNNKETSKDTTDSKIRKFSNNLLYVTQLQELMLIENEPTLKTPIHLFLWVLEKMSNEMYNYYNKNNLKVTTSLIKDLFSFSKKTISRCRNYDHVNVVVNVGNYCVDYSESSETPKNNRTVSNNTSFDYCKECNKVVECVIEIEYLSSPNLLLIDFINYRVENIPRELVFNDHKYNLECFYFTLPAENLHYRSLACIKLPQNFKTEDYNWILINDGIVMYVDEDDDVFNFTKNCKILLFAIYSKASTEESGEDKNHNENFVGIEEIIPCANVENNIVSIKNRLVPLPYPTKKIPVPPYVLLSEHNIAHNPLAHNKIKTFTPISIHELNLIQESNFMFALDIEYVKTDLKNTPVNDSSNEKSSFIVNEDENNYLYSLARVTAIRANDDNLHGVPFLDHYILNNKPPKDYNTRFSGIRSGDLELKSSLHWLTTHKLIYLKLRYLIDNGCKVIGHGLEQDLRILNICVPSGCVIDTLELFWIPGKRYMSLQFLSYHILNQKIQVSEHNSIEDAKTSLHLYK
ncbi:exonuclease, putative [Theileria annulata]|uniref:Exonuclease, putative n=1 Tax=Theileria annulata TaxID=5874 RepID=Q4UEG0_THEAN|nr:exonuclease, putative [Theileria annulata]CAI74529.1 exonuclease, putative [Theileria annulata]|eukprot:XP_952261.1 exonuclease, putative [Theileria annulata]